MAAPPTAVKASAVTAAAIQAPAPSTSAPAPPLPEGAQRFSAFSLKGLQTLHQSASEAKASAHPSGDVPTEAFTETDMRTEWYRFADRLNDKGKLIMESLLRISEPRLEGETIVHELPNVGSKLDFESDQMELLTHLRSKLHNHNIQIRIDVNEHIEKLKAFTPQDRYHRLNNLNPALDHLRRLFDLEW